MGEEGHKRERGGREMRGEERGKMGRREREEVEDME